MKLTPAETDWITNKLNGYDIKYQEIYDELKDHLISAVEYLRDNGDNRSIEIVYKEVVNDQFPGFWPFDDIVKQYQAAYRVKINNALGARLRHYLNWQTIPVVLVMLVLSFYIPQSKPASVIMMLILLLAAMVPLCYGYLSGRKIKPDKGRQSLLKNQVRLHSNLLLGILNVVLNLFGAIGRSWAWASFLNPIHYHPMVFTVLIGFFIIYGMACIRLIKQEFKYSEV